MRYLRYLGILALVGTAALVGASNASAQRIAVGVGIGPGYIGPAPICSYGYYDYYPYACAPYGYYGPEWFNGGIFIGAGPWFRGGFRGRPGFFGRPGFAGRPGFGGRPGVVARGGFARGPVGGSFRGGAAVRGGGGGSFRGGASVRGGGGGSFHGGGGGHGHR
jgi:hypothetical protein